MAIITKKNHYVNDADEETKRLMEEADGGFKRLTLNFFTQESFEEFLEKTGLFSLNSKSSVVFSRPKKTISSFF